MLNFIYCVKKEPQLVKYKKYENYQKKNYLELLYDSSSKLSTTEVHYQWDMMCWTVLQFKCCQCHWQSEIKAWTNVSLKQFFNFSHITKFQVIQGHKNFSVQRAEM